MSTHPARNKVTQNSDLMLMIASFLASRPTEDQDRPLILSSPILPLIMTFRSLYSLMMSEKEKCEEKMHVISSMKDFATNLPLVEWATGMGCDFRMLDRYLCHEASKRGDLDMLQWALRQDPPYVWDEMACNFAAINGHLNVLQFLRIQDPCHWSERVLDHAARNGHLNVLKWLDLPEILRSRNHYVGGEWIFAIASSSGNLEMMQWLRSLDPPCQWSPIACSNVANLGLLDVLIWMRGEDPPCPWDAHVCAAAASGGHMHVLQWLRSQDPAPPQDARSCVYAAANGRLEVLKWLRNQDPPCPWNSETFGNAAKTGNIEILEWLHNQQPPCPWDAWTCAHAARAGHLEALRWLRAQDPPCPWDEWTRMYAASSGHEAILEWLDTQDAPAHALQPLP
jgi:hypothetical protein